MHFKLIFLTVVTLLSNAQLANGQNTVELLNDKLYFAGTNNHLCYDIDDDQVNDICFYRGVWPIDSDIMAIYRLSDSIQFSFPTTHNNNFVWSQPMLYDTLCWIGERTLNIAYDWFTYPVPMNESRFIGYYKKYNSTDSLFGYFRVTPGEGPVAYSVYEDTLFIHSHVQALNTNDPLIAGEACEFNILYEDDYTCLPGCNGSIEIEIEGGVAPYSYLWSNGATTQNLENMCSGIYTVTITDDNNCIWEDTVTIDSAYLKINELNTYGIYSGNNCDIDVIAYAEGLEPLSYNWTNGSTNSFSNNLCDGWHLVTVTDSAGCTVTDSIEITFGNEFNTSVHSFNLTSGWECGGPVPCNENFPIYIYNGVEPYIVNVSNGYTDTIYGNQVILDSICPGFYTYSVQDSTGQIITNNFTVNEAPYMDLWVMDYQAPTCPTCNDGWVEFFKTGGGSGPYFMTLIPVGTTNSQFQFNNGYFNNLSYDLYELCIESVEGCTACQYFSFDSVFCYVQANIIANKPSCPGATDGSISIDTYSAYGNVSISTTDGITQLIGPNDFLITGLAASSIDILLTDMNGCTYSENGILIVDPDTVNWELDDLTLPTCGSCSDGTLELSGNGGTQGNYQYSIDGGLTWQNSGAFNGLIPSDYNVCILDSNGCMSCNLLTLDSCEISMDLISQSTTCFNICDGETQLTIHDGVNPNITYLNQGNLIQNNDSVFNIMNLCAGNLLLNVEDSTGCLLSKSITIDQPDSLYLSIAPINSVSCFGACDGSLTGVISGGSPSYNFTASYGIDTILGNSFQVDSLCSDDLILTTSDGNSCIRIDTLAITQPDSLSFTFTLTDTTSCTTCNDGAGFVSIIGGTAPYMLDWSDFGSSSIDTLAADLEGGTGVICVTDANGCQFCDSVYVEFIDDVGFNENDGPFEIVPNPSNGEQIMVRSSLPFSQISIYSSNGQVVLTSDNQMKTNQILNLAELSNGIYLIEITGDNYHAIQKLVIQK
jgi:hypothetical protein